MKTFLVLCLLSVMGGCCLPPLPPSAYPGPKEPIDIKPPSWTNQVDNGVQP